MWPRRRRVCVWGGRPHRSLSAVRGPPRLALSSCRLPPACPKEPRAWGIKGTGRTLRNSRGCRAGGPEGGHTHLRSRIQSPRDSAFTSHGTAATCHSDMWILYVPLKGPARPCPVPLSSTCLLTFPSSASHSRAPFSVDTGRAPNIELSSRPFISSEHLL